VKICDRDDIDAMISDLMLAYGEDIDCNAFRDELLQFLRFTKQESVQTPSDIYKILTQGLKATFPNVETILRIYLTIPISNATGERTFSALKRVKSYLRNSMGQERLASLSILCIESDETKKCDFNVQIDAFAKLKCRKKPL
jgi:hypothetical protein